MFFVIWLEPLVSLFFLLEVQGSNLCDVVVMMPVAPGAHQAEHHGEEEQAVEETKDDHQEEYLEERQEDDRL